MKHVISLFLMLFICSFVHGQVKSDKLQKEQKIMLFTVSTLNATFN